jgi:lysophospholipase L1-like esterase
MKRSFNRLAAALVGLTGALCAAEILLRVLILLHLGPYPQVDESEVIHRYADSFDLVYEMKENGVGLDGDVEVRTNSMGNKDLEYPIEKPAGVYRIALLGDSVAFGLGVRTEHVFAKLLERMLNESPIDGQKFDRAEILNFSVVGYNSWQEEIVLREKVLRTSPDAVMVGYCLNDDTRTDGIGPLAKQMHPQALGSRLHSRLMNLSMHAFERLTYSAFTNSNGAESLFTSLKQAEARFNILPIVLIFPYRFDDPATYGEMVKHRAVRELAESKGIRVLDFLDHTKQLSREDRAKLYRNVNDHIHFSGAGMQAMAVWLFERRDTFLNKN